MFMLMIKNYVVICIDVMYKMKQNDFSIIV